MCVLALAWQAHPRWRLILAGNRDEFHARPAAPLARWEDPNHIIAGRDLEAGGTWLGVSEQGRLAVITNRHRAPSASTHLTTRARRSRGALVTDILTHADPYKADLDAFNPFNLIIADHCRAQSLTNYPETAAGTLASGIYGLSNGALDEPWPKTVALKSALHDWTMQETEAPEALLEILASRTLPDFPRAPATAEEGSEEPRLSPIFIHNPIYGTRCSTVVTIDTSGNGTIIERRYAPSGESVGETIIYFRWPSHKAVSATPIVDVL